MDEPKIVRIRKTLQESMNEENRIREEMNKIIETMPGKTQEEKIAEANVFEKFALLLDEASKNTSKLKTEWLEAIRSAQDEYKKTEGAYSDTLKEFKEKTGM